MEYKRIYLLDNQYPNAQSYKDSKLKPNTVTLFGVYPEKNSIDFAIPSIENLKWVADTNFRFIMAIFKTYEDTNPVYYTSMDYYVDIKDAISTNQPYFVQAVFNSTNIVSIVVEDFENIYTQFSEAESKAFVSMRMNLFMKSDGGVLYDNLVRYIDWMVSTPSPLDTDNFGVLVPESIAGWDILKGNYVTGKLETGVSGSFGIGANSANSSISTSNGKLDEYNSILNSLSEKYGKLNSSISNIDDVLNSNKFQVPPIGKVTVNIDGQTFQSDSINGKSRVDEVKQKINDYKNNLLAQTKEIDSKIQDVSGKITDVKNSLDSTVASLSGISKFSTDALEALGTGSVGDYLMSKIPKIPPIPKIPKLPKLSALEADAAAKLADLKSQALNAIPAIPKISLPKLGKIHFPALPKLHLKKPKVPKKINKGLKGLLESAKNLSDAANSVAAQAQGAVNEVQSGVKSAQAAVVSAQSTVTNAANQAQESIKQAQAAVTSAQSAASAAINQAKAAVEQAKSDAQKQVEQAKATAQTKINEAKSTIDSVKNKVG